MASEPWSKDDVNRQAVLTSMLVADWGQTLDIERHRGDRTEVITYGPQLSREVPRTETRSFVENNNGMHEHNLFLGRNPSRGRVNGYFGVAIVGSYLAADALPPVWRARFQYALIAVQVVVVSSNYSLGMKVRF
jgi:hypothetical protein